MAQLIGQPFDATQVDPTQGAGSLPVGKHPVIAVSSSIDATKAGDGGMLVYILKIIDGPYSGTTGPYRLNLYNNNPKAVEIAQRQLSALCHVTGVYQVADSDALLNIPFVIEVAPQKDDPSYTEIKKVFDINGNEPGKPPANGGPAQTQGQQAGQFQGGQQQQQQGPAQQQWGNGQQNQQAAGGQQWGNGQQQQQQQFQQQEPQQQQFNNGQQQGNGQFGNGQQQQQQFQGNQQQQGNGQQWGGQQQQSPQNNGQFGGGNAGGGGQPMPWGQK